MGSVCLRLVKITHRKWRKKRPRSLTKLGEEAEDRASGYEGYEPRGLRSGTDLIAHEKSQYFGGGDMRV